MAPEEEVLRVAGLDMAIFVRLITFCKLTVGVLQSIAYIFFPYR